MVNWTLTFVVLAVVAAVLGFGGLAADSAYIAKVLIVVLLELSLISFVTERRVKIP